MRVWTTASVGMVLTAWAAAAHAAQTTDTYTARINIQTTCAITVSDLDFGNVGVISTHTATATVGINCSLGTAYSLSFSNTLAVTNYTGAMTNGPNSVAYSAALGSAGGIGPGTTSIMGLILPQPTPPTGLYTDNRTVYLNY